MAGAEADAMACINVLADLPGPFELVSVSKSNAPRAHRFMVREQPTQAVCGRVDFGGAQARDLLARIAAHESACVDSFAQACVQDGRAVHKWEGRARDWLQLQKRPVYGKARQSLQRVSSSAPASDAQKQQRAEALRVAQDNSAWAGPHKETLLQVSLVSRASALTSRALRCLLCTCTHAAASRTHTPGQPAFHPPPPSTHVHRWDGCSQVSFLRRSTRA